MRRFAAPPPIEIFAVEESSAQLVWRDLGPGVRRFQLSAIGGSAPTRTWQQEVLPGPDSLELTELDPGQRYELTITGRPEGDRSAKPGRLAKTDTHHRLGFTTLTPPDGARLLRIATVNDIHIGSHRFGFTRTMTERPAAPVPSGLRCARAAFDAIARWQPDHLVIKGDFIHDGTTDDWAHGWQMVEELGVPWDFALGNHESSQADNLPGQFAPRDYDLAAPVRWRDMPGLRLIVADTARPASHRGFVAHLQEEIVEVAAESPQPVLLCLHHNLQPRRLAWMMPAGVSGTEAVPLLDGLAAERPDSMVISGHTHRHRRRHHGPIPVIETGSTKDYPGTWSGYEIYETGIRQVVRRVAQPDCLTWTDYTAGAVLGAWGRWSPGQLEDRCFVHLWPTPDTRPGPLSRI